MSNTPIPCYRCQEDIGTQKSLIVGEAKGKIYPFHYKCFEEEKWESTSRINGKLIDLDAPDEPPSWNRFLYGSVAVVLAGLTISSLI